MAVASERPDLALAALRSPAAWLRGPRFCYLTHAPVCPSHRENTREQGGSGECLGAFLDVQNSGGYLAALAVSCP